MPSDPSLQADLALRLIGAAVLGALIGAERESHGHPAGMRTHLLVALGSALFTVMSAYGFGTADGAANVDPSRIAAQVVSGIGFLGAGAIIKFGASIRGLTTAASLWATAAVGLAVAAGWWLLAAVSTAIVLISLWPLRWVAHRLRGGRHALRVQLHLRDLDGIGSVTRALRAQRVEIADIDSRQVGSGIEVSLALLVPPAVRVADVVDELRTLADVGVVSSEVDPD